jgi:general secretion pathway protein D
VHRFVYLFLRKILLLCLTLFFSSCAATEFPESKIVFPVKTEIISGTDASKMTAEDKNKKNHAASIIPQALQQKVTVHCFSQMSLLDFLKQIFSLTEISWILGEDLENALSNKMGIQFFVKDMPLYELLGQLMELRLLRFFWKNDTLFLLKDEPYTASYDIQFLLATRQSSYASSFSDEKSISHYIDSLEEDSHRDLSGSATAGSSQKTKTASPSNQHRAGLRHENTPNFWKELEHNLDLILPPNANGKKNYALHQYGGVLTIHAPQFYHALIVQYLTKLKRLISAQVLIEARIIELELKKDNAAGVNFYKFKTYLEEMGAMITLPHHDKVNGAMISFLKDSTKAVSEANLTTDSFSFLLDGMKKYGRASILSEPRLLVTNNQTGVLSVTTNEIFFSRRNQKLLLQKKAYTLDKSSHPHLIPVGILMIIQPSICGSLDNPSITLSLRFTYSNKVGHVSDGDGKNSVPIIQEKNIDTVVVFDQETENILIGGLIVESESSDNHMGIFSGLHFKKAVNNKELLIWMKATMSPQNQKDTAPLLWLIPRESR